MSADDPLQHADVGETRTIRREEIIDCWAPDVYYGSDREHLTQPDVADVELVETADGDYNNVRIVWEGEVQKQLARNWDQCDEPRTPAEERAARRRRLLAGAVRAVSLVLPLAVVLGVGHAATSALAGEVTINGEPMVADPVVTITATALVIIIAVIVMWGVSGGFPRPAGGGRR